jgi:hypothetical protein
MVLGIGEGSIEILIGSNTFHEGGEIKGSVRLTLSQPTPANALGVRFYGIIKRSKNRTETISLVTQYLGQKRTYNTGEQFEFSLQIPPNAIPKNPFTGIVGTLYGAFSPHPKWYLDAGLDMPMKFDIRRKISINLLPNPAQNANNKPV